MTFNLIQDLDEIYICKIKEMDVPIGVNIKGSVTGLEISYELTEDSYNQFYLLKNDTASIHSSLTSNSLIKKSINVRTDRRFNPLDTKIIDKTLRNIEFKNLKVNKPNSFKFIIKNHSGINTYFNFSSKNFSPGIEKDLKYEMVHNQLGSEINMVNTSNGLNNSVITLSSLRKSQQLKKISSVIAHELLNDNHELVNFTSPKGLEYTKTKQIEKEAIMYLSSKKGVAIIIEPKSGKIEPYSENLISVTIYNECVGDFEDELISQIKGLPERRFPINMKIRGNPLQLAPFQTGIDYYEEPPIIKMGNVITKINSISKSFKIINTGSNLISLDWKVFDYDDILDPSGNIFKIKIHENKGNFNLRYLPCEPKEFPDDKIFNVDPRNVLIHPKGFKEFKVTFRTEREGLRSAILVAYPKFIDNYTTSNVKLTELSIKIDAYGINPKLIVDKNMNLEGKYNYRFHLHSYGISPKSKKSIVLINQEKMNLILKIIIEGPYKINKIEPLEATIGNMLYNVNPKSNLKVEIKALTPDQKNLEEWPITLINEKNGKLICIFENGESQIYYLTSLIKRPRISMSVTGNDSIKSDNIINFESVSCESFKKSVLFLKNETCVETDWSINYNKFIIKKYYGYGTTTIEEKEDQNMNDDPDVFLFSLTNGVILGPSLPLINIPIGPGLPKVDNTQRNLYLPVKIEIMFKPKKNVFYKSRYKIITSTGNTIDFVLKGQGSYFEEEIQ